jgi:hypothetical protein
MKKKALLISVILILVAAISVSVISAKEKTQPINWDLTGSIMNLGDAGSQFDVNLKGAPGDANARGLGFAGLPAEKGDLPDDNVCVDLPNSPDGVPFVEAQMIVHFNDGSMLFGNAAEGGYVCFVPSFAYVPYNFAGGTGRFEGATGYVLFEINAHNFNEEGKGMLVTGETGTGTGEIILP